MVEPKKTATPNKTPGTVTKDDTTSDVSSRDLDKAANAGAVAKGDSPSDTKQEGAGDLNLDPRAPYPTGSPPDPAVEWEKIHGYPPPPAKPAKETK